MHALDYLFLALWLGMLGVAHSAAHATYQPRGLGEASVTVGVGFSDGWDSVTANAVAAAREGR